MNKVILMGRLTRDPVIRYSNSENPIAVANYTLAVDRKYKRQGDDQTADFIRCVAFGKNAEFAERKRTEPSAGYSSENPKATDGFIPIPEGLD